jgi:hypothetical protein
MILSAQPYADELRQDGYIVTAELPAGVDHCLPRDMVVKTLELYHQVQPPLDGSGRLKNR